MAAACCTMTSPHTANRALPEQTPLSAPSAGGASVDLSARPKSPRPFMTEKNADPVVESSATARHTGTWGNFGETVTGELARSRQRIACLLLNARL